MSEMTPYERSLVEHDVRNEVLKLYLIVKASNAPIARSYLREKIKRIIGGFPIALDMGKQVEYNRMVGEE